MKYNWDISWSTRVSFEIESIFEQYREYNRKIRIVSFILKLFLFYSFILKEIIYLGNSSSIF